MQNLLILSAYIIMTQLFNIRTPRKVFFLTKRYIFAKIEDSTMPTTDMTPSEFGRLFITRRDSFIKIARTYVRDQAIAEDIVSECFTLFWDKHESIDLKASPEAYIMKSVKNRCLNYLRDNAKIMHSEGSIDPEVNLRIKSMLSEISVLESSDMGEIFSSEVEGIFRKFLADMPELSRSIFISSRFEDLTYEEIAAKYGVSPRKVKREIQKALEILRVSLKDYLPILLLLISNG